MEHNREFYNEPVFSTQKYDDWLIVAMFYEIVHLLESYIFETSKKHSSGHVERDDYISNDPCLKEIVEEYRDLYTMTNKARYHCIPVSTSDMRAAEEDATYIKRFISKLS